MAPMESDRGASDNSSKNGDYNDNEKVGKSPAFEKVAPVDDGEDEAELVRRRELNRLCKIRCRKRRNDLIKNLQADVTRLAAEYHALRTENEQLRNEFLMCCMVNGQQGQPTQVDTTGFSLTQNLSNSNMTAANPLLPTVGTFGFPPEWSSEFLANVVMAINAFNTASMVSSANGSASEQSITSSSQGIPIDPDRLGYSNTASAQRFPTNGDLSGYLGNASALGFSSTSDATRFPSDAPGPRGSLGIAPASGQVSSDLGYWNDANDAVRMSYEEQEAASGATRKREE